MITAMDLARVYLDAQVAKAPCFVSTAALARHVGCSEIETLALVAALQRKGFPCVELHGFRRCPNCGFEQALEGSDGPTISANTRASSQRPCISCGFVAHADEIEMHISFFCARPHSTDAGGHSSHSKAEIGSAVTLRQLEGALTINVESIPVGPRAVTIMMSDTASHTAIPKLDRTAGAQHNSALRSRAEGEDDSHALSGTLNVEAHSSERTQLATRRTGFEKTVERRESGGLIAWLFGRTTSESTREGEYHETTTKSRSGKLYVGIGFVVSIAVVTLIAWLRGCA